MGEDSTPANTTAGTPGHLPDGHPTGVVHPGLENATKGDATFAGKVRLEGTLATRGGYLFVTVFPEGVRMPCYSRKFDLKAKSDEIQMDGDALVVTFLIDENYSLGGLVPGNLVIEANYDPDGIVDTREPERVATSQAVTPDATGIELVLSSGS